MKPVTQSNQVIEMHRGEFLLNTDAHQVDINLIHRFLTDCCWAKAFPSMSWRAPSKIRYAFGVYVPGKQVGIARVISDFATDAYAEMSSYWIRLEAAAWESG